jgi:hypothetical protein
VSNERRAWSWRQRLLKSDLRGTTRHVLLTLSCHVNDAGEPCFPSIKQLMQETDLSKQTVLTHLEIAKEEGWITIRRHGFSGQKWSRNEYLLAWPDDEKAVKEIDLETLKSVEGGLTVRPKAVKEVDLETGHHIEGFSHVLPINPSASVDAGVLPFDRFWQAWPQSMHKKYKAECRRKWERMKLDREIDLVLAHVANVIAKSDAALRDGGQYLMGPRSYITNAEWREAVAMVNTKPDVCAKCGALARYKRGGTWLCQTHFNEREDD